jgi:hypothetical protein
MDTNKLLDLLYNLDYYTQTAHLDMGGKHRYSIWGKGHETLTEIKAFLHELDKEKGD